MGNFANNAITDAGRIMLADVHAGAVFTPTRIVMGSGYLPSTETVHSIKNVVTPVKSLEITKKQKTPDGKCIFGGVYNNADITDAFYFRELALYAKAVYLNEDGTVASEGAETLYSYGNAGDTADLMPAYSTSTVVERELELVTWVGNNAQVDLTIEGGLYVPQSEKGAAGGVATLGADGKVPESQLPVQEIIVDSALSDTSTNPVQNKVVNEALENKAPSAHSHDWSSIANKPSSFTPASHTHAASEIAAGAFAGQVVANSSGQTPGTMLLRNSKLVSADTNPTVNGEICWTYK